MVNKEELYPYSNSGLFLVIIGMFADKDKAEKLASALKNKGFECYIIKLL